MSTLGLTIYEPRKPEESYRQHLTIPCFPSFSHFLNQFGIWWNNYEETFGTDQVILTMQKNGICRIMCIIGSTCSTEFHGIRHTFTIIYTNCVLFTTQTLKDYSDVLYRWEPSTLDEDMEFKNRPTFCLSEDGPMVLSTPQSLSITPKWLGPQQAIASLSTVRAFLGVSYKTSRTLSTLATHA